MAYFNDGDYGGEYSYGYSRASYPYGYNPNRIMRDDHVYVAIRRDVAAQYDTPEDALAAYLETKGYSVGPGVWPRPHFETAQQLANQGKYWVNAQREKLEILKMDLEYVANVLDYLRKYKPDLLAFPRSAGGGYYSRPIKTTLARALEQRLEDAKIGTDHYRDRYRYRRTNK